MVVSSPLRSSDLCLSTVMVSDIAAQGGHACRAQEEWADGCRLCSGASIAGRWLLLIIRLVCRLVSMALACQCRPWYAGRVDSASERLSPQVRIWLAPS